MTERGVCLERRNINIDVIRIFAALLVLFVHVGQYSGLSFDVGAKGVTLFFVLSGYLAFASLDTNPSAVNYLKKRAIRILPTYWTCLLIDYLYQLLYGSVTESFSAVISGQCSFRYLRYVFFLHSWLPNKEYNLWNNHNGLWTMCAFSFFYLIAPILFKIMKRFYVSVGVFIAVLFASPFFVGFVKKAFSEFPETAHIDWFANQHPLSVLYCFLFGAVLFIAIKQSKESIYLFGLLALLFCSQISWYKYEIVCVVFILIAVKLSSVTENKRICQIVKFFANSSFSLYLIHPIVLSIASKIWRLMGFQNAVLYSVYLSLGSIIVSALVYFLVIKKIEHIIQKKLER